MIILAVIYCIIFCVTTYLFILDICNGYFKDVNFSLIIWLYILYCLLWPIGVIVILCDDKMKNQQLIKSDEKENKRKMVCEVLEELKIR